MKAAPVCESSAFQIPLPRPSAEWSIWPVEFTGPSLLVGFVSMEAVKVWLYNRLLRCLEEALAVVRLAEAEPPERRVAAAPAAAG
jgi:hypothetical protein